MCIRDRVIGDTIILPLVDISFGMGAGAFNKEKGSSAGGGIGGKMSPSAILVIHNGQTKLVNIRDQDAVTKVLDMVPDAVNKVVSIIKGEDAEDKVDPEVESAVNKAAQAEDVYKRQAQRHHCRVRTLLDLNPFVDIYNLQPGEEICVPDCRGQGKVDFRPYVVKEGDTLKIILKNVSMTFEELAKVNRILYNLTVPAGTILLVPAKKE